jgi:hypothetical protein
MKIQIKNVNVRKREIFVGGKSGGRSWELNPPGNAGVPNRI